MSIKIMTRVWEYSQHKGNDLLTLLALADAANDRGHCWPGVGGDLSKKTRLSRRAVGNRIESLAKSGELVVFPNKGRSHDYIVTVAMTCSEYKQAVKLVAGKRNLSTMELSHLRRKFAGGDEVVPAKKVRTPCESIFAGGAKRGSHEPSLTIREPSEPKGLDASGASTPPPDERSDTGSPSDNGDEKLTPHQAMMGVLEEVCGTPIAVMPRRYGEVSKILRDAGRTPDDVKYFGEVYRTMAKKQGWSNIPFTPSPNLVAKYIHWVDVDREDRGVEPIVRMD